MAVKIRLQRGGAKHKPMYRMVVADSRSKRDGRFIEVIGAYDPKNKVEGRQVKVDLERAAYWMGVGAQPSDTARTIINRAKREAAARGSDQDAAAKPAASSAPAAVEPAVKEATEVANQSAEASPTGEPVAGSGESGATAVAPQEAEEAAREEESK